VTLAEALVTAAILVLLIAAVFDLVRMEIPDALPILVLMLVSAHWFAAPEASIWWSPIAAFCVMLAIGLLLFSRGWMGGGDIKLLVALAPLAGLAGLPLLLAVIAIFGGLLALLFLGLRTGLRAAGHDGLQLPQVLRQAAPLPYAVAIAAGSGFWAWRMGLMPV
jgi:prepilin peptidase CpaA